MPESKGNFREILKQPLRKIGAIGITNERHSFEKKQIQYTNQIAFIFFLLTLPHALIFAYAEMYFAAWMCVSASFLFLFTLYINHTRNFKVATVYYIIVTNFVIFFFAALLGKSTGIQQIFVTAAFLPLAIYPQRRTLLIFCFGCLTTLLYALVEIPGIIPSQLIYQDIPQHFLIYFFPYRVLAILLPIIQLNSNRKASERALLSTQEELLATNAKLKKTVIERAGKIQTQSSYLNLIVSSIPVLLFSVGVDEVVRFSEGKGFKDLNFNNGFGPGEKIGALFTTRNHPLMSNIRKAISGEHCEAEIDIMNVPHLCICTPIYKEDGSPDGMVGMAYNIADAIKQQNQIKNLSQILEESTDYIGSMDLKGKPAYLNRAFKNLLNKDIHEISDLSILYPEEDFKLVQEALQISLEKGVWSGDINIYDHQGNTIPVSKLIICHKDADGEPSYFSTVMRNMSTQLKDKAQLAKYAHELETSNADLRYFAFITSHDLKEPIRNIAVHVQLLEKTLNGKLSEEANEYLSFIRNNSVRVSNLVTGIMKYIRLDNLEEKPFEDVNVHAVMAELLESYRQFIADHHAQVHYEGLEHVYFHKYYLSMILQNLIENGVKYNKAKIPTINISSVVEANEIIFKVSDNGIGIADHHKEQVFTMFKRLHTYDAYEGHGIGLAACKRIVEGYKGRMWFESEEGIGSTFYFSIRIQEHIK
jgi:PAS domain S-box-containing protein